MDTLQTESDYALAMAKAEILMGMDPELDSREGKELDTLMDSIMAYETKQGW